MLRRPRCAKAHVMTEALTLIAAGGDMATMAVAGALWWHHIRVRRIERHLWPDYFKAE